jgi:hypothetical protein
MVEKGRYEQEYKVVDKRHNGTPSLLVIDEVMKKSIA